MPTIDIDYTELQRLLKVNLNGDMEKLDDILSYVKAEVKGFDEKEDAVTIEFKDTNRPDLWSIEGLSRALRGYLGQEKGIKTYSIGESAVEVNVDAKIYRHSPLHLLRSHQRHSPLRRNHQRHHASAGEAGPDNGQKPTKNQHRHLQP